jgi:hypothetical protein
VIAMTLPRFLLTTGFTVICLIIEAWPTPAQDTTAVGSVSGVVNSGDARLPRARCSASRPAADASPRTVEASSRSPTCAPGNYRQNVAGYTWNRGLNTAEVNQQLGIFPFLGLDWRF